jgi:hypothetical protein
VRNIPAAANARHRDRQENGWNSDGDLTAPTLAAAAIVLLQLVTTFGGAATDSTIAGRRERGGVMRAIIRVTSAACIMLVVAASARAQTAIRPNEWSQGTTLNGFVGVPFESGETGVALGGGVGWEITPRYAIEATGSWLDFDDSATGFAGSIALRTRLFGRRTVDPFLQGGIGMYRASFGSTENLPPFYEGRASARELLGSVTFTDPTLIAGGGVNIFLNRHLALRPDVAATFVLNDGRHEVITTAAIHLVFHFEDHPVTPALRPRR